IYFLLSYIYFLKLPCMGNAHAPSLDYDHLLMNIDGVPSAVDADKYEIYVTLKYPQNYQWDDNTVDTVTFKWQILRREIDKPRLEKESFDYNGKAQSPVIIGFEKEAMTAFGDTSAEIVGKYTITIVLSKNYMWTGGSTENVLLKWEIIKIIIPKPNVFNTSFTYDGNIHAPHVSEFNENVIICVGTQSAVNAGDYNITFSLKDKEGCLWDDLSSDDLSVDWSIHKISVSKPTVTNTHFIYNGGRNLPTVHGYNSDIMYEDGTREEINAGSYIFKIGLTDTVNYMWADETIDILNFPWDISRMSIELPYVDPKNFVYNGEYQSPEIKNFDDDTMVVVRDSDISACDVGEYTIIIQLNTSNHEWNDGTVNDICLIWSIIPKSVKYPSLIEAMFVYDTKEHSPKISDFIPNAMGIDGTKSAVNADKYGIKFYLTDTKNYKWEEGTVEEEYSWEITPAILDKYTNIPWQNPILTYNGEYQTPDWENYDKDKLFARNVVSGKNAGEYTAEFVPTNNYIWSDGTREPVTVQWIIEKLGIAEPTQANLLYFNGREQSPEWDYNKALVNIVFIGSVTEINSGRYEVSCVCDSNCYFIRSGTDTSFTYWTINKQALPSPYAIRKYYYTGNVITPEFYNYNPDILEISGDVNGVDIGDYIALFDIKDKSNYVWNNDVILLNKNSGKAAAGWVILNSIKIVPIPHQRNYLIYNGEKQSPEWGNYDVDTMILIGGTPFEVNAGEYYVTFALRAGYMWSDGTIDNKIVPWKIYKMTLPYPRIKTSESDGLGAYYYEHEGKRYPIWLNYDPKYMDIGGDSYDIDNSWHVTYFNLKDTNNFEWEDGRADSYSVRWKLTEPYDPKIAGGNEKKKVHIPRQINAPKTDGTVKRPEWDYYDSAAIVNLGGEWEEIEAGEYFVVLELKEGYIWEDNTEGVKVIPWKIYDIEENPSEEQALTSVHIPKQINPPYYDGTVKQPEWDEWNEYGIDYKFGELYGMPAGIYYIRVSLKTGYIWEDGTLEDKTLEWVINPRKEDSIAVPENPRQPEPESEEEENNGVCCCMPCCDTGLFDKLNNCEFDDGFNCGCDNSN
ncbi:MAG: hypothetical protein NC452_15215, partial [Eubacterium sp.]|nr:hypothetical protein [Eubacterium sp.]